MCLSHFALADLHRSIESRHTPHDVEIRHLLSQSCHDRSRRFRKRASVESTSTIIFTKKSNIVEIPVELLSTLALLAKLLK